MKDAYVKKTNLVEDGFKPQKLDVSFSFEVRTAEDKDNLIARYNKIHKLVNDSRHCPTGGEDCQNCLYEKRVDNGYCGCIQWIDGVIDTLKGLV